MRELTKRQKQTALKTVEEILQRCRPLLVGFGGSIAYGLHTPESDIDIRGIFLNPREEWIGLKPETENFRLNDSDTVLYGLRKGYRPLAVGPPAQTPQQIAQLQYPLVTTVPRDSPTRTVRVLVSV